MRLRFACDRLQCGQNSDVAFHDKPTTCSLIRELSGAKSRQASLPSSLRRGRCPRNFGILAHEVKYTTKGGNECRVMSIIGVGWQLDFR